MPDINWSLLSGYSDFSKALWGLLFDCNLVQLVIEPTHAKGNTLDLVITNHEKLIIYGFLSNLMMISLSSQTTLLSHLMLISLGILLQKIRLSLSLITQILKSRLRGSFKPFVGGCFSQCLNCNNVEEVWSFIRDSIMDALPLFILKESGSGHTSAPPPPMDEINSTACLRSMKKKQTQSRSK